MLFPLFSYSLIVAFLILFLHAIFHLKLSSNILLILKAQHKWITSSLQV